MTINGVDPKDFGAELKLEYTVGMPELDTQTLQGRNRTNFILTAQILGMREIALPFVITGLDHADIMYRKSYLDQLFMGKCELFLPDDFYYSAAVDTFEDVEFKGPQLAECEYTLVGIRHGALISVVGNTIYCECYSNLNHTSAACTTPPATGVLPLCTRLRRVRRNNPPWRSL